MYHLKCVQVSSLTPFYLLALTVKPTVIDVGIYVNSIGPVSSIDMVSKKKKDNSFSCLYTHMYLSSV